MNNPPRGVGEVAQQDDLYDYGVEDNVLFQTFEPNLGGALQAQTTEAADLGVDEEIRLTKKREPIPKLDETRLLSQAGIPKLRRITKTRLKFKGKGHEFSDVLRLLNTYQLWLDDLYPRAKFADALYIIEKLGHSKRMHVMRREWIAEAKRKQGDPDDDRTQLIAPSVAQSAARPTGSNSQDPGGSTEKDSSSEQMLHLPTISRAPQAVTEDLADSELDELDALLAQDRPSYLSRVAPSPDQHEENLIEFADEMDVLAEMER